MTVNQLFKEQPAPEFVYQYCQLFGLSGISDRRWFGKKDMMSNNTIRKINKNLLDDLKKLYIKCKARSYLTDIDDKLALTVLRQLIKTQGYSINKKAVCVSGTRMTLYQLNKI
jgi:hypothetical protein